MHTKAVTAYDGVTNTSSVEFWVRSEIKVLRNYELSGLLGQNISWYALIFFCLLYYKYNHWQGRIQKFLIGGVQKAEKITCLTLVEQNLSASRGERVPAKVTS